MSRKSQLSLPLFCLVVFVLLFVSPVIAQATQSHGAQTPQPTTSQAPPATPAVESGQAQAPAAGQGEGGATTGQAGCCMGKQQHGGDGCMMMRGAGQGRHGQMGQAGGPAQGGGRMMGRMGQAGGPARGRRAMGSGGSQPEAVQAGQGQGHGGRGQGPAMDPEMQEHRDTVHSLLSNNTKIKRYVELLPNGMKATTESDDQATAALIKQHVPQVYKLLQTKRTVRNWDPLFVEIFKHSDKIKMTIEPTEKGVRVTETSDDSYTVQLIQEHSKVIDNFVATGWTAAQKQNPVPAKK